MGDILAGIMHRNRGRNVARTSSRKKQRNVTRIEGSDDDSFSSDGWDSSTLSDLDSSEITDETNVPSSSASVRPCNRRSSGSKVNVKKVS